MGINQEMVNNPNSVLKQGIEGPQLHQSLLPLLRPLRLGPVNGRAHPAGNLVLPVVFLDARDIGELAEALGDARIEFALEQGQQCAADPVASKSRIEVAGVLPPGLAYFAQVRFEFAMSHFQQRPDHFAHDFAVFFQVDGWINPSQAAHPGAPKYPHQHGLGLIVERVAGGDLAELGVTSRIRFDELLEKSITQLASRRFQTEALGRRFFLHIRAGRMERQLVLARELGNEGLIFVGLDAAESVIEMHDGEDGSEFGAELKQKSQQRHRICATGNGNAHTVPGLQQLKLSNVAKNSVREKMHGDMIQLTTA